MIKKDSHRAEYLTKQLFYRKNLGIKHKKSVKFHDNSIQTTPEE